MSESQPPPQNPPGGSERPDPPDLAPKVLNFPAPADVSLTPPNASAQNIRGGLPYTSGAFLTVQQSSSWQGPYPSPDAVERFEAILPGAFDRILTMAEKAQDSQLETNENAQLFLQRDVMRSHYLGAAISALALVCATGCALTGHPTVSVALVGIPVMAVARAFVNSRAPRPAPDEDDTVTAETAVQGEPPAER